MSTVYDFEALQINGKPVALSQFKGKVMLIVNTASACGFTPQFAGLEELHESYGEKGLVVLGLFSNYAKLSKFMCKTSKKCSFHR